MKSLSLLKPFIIPATLVCLVATGCGDSDNDNTPSPDGGALPPINLTYDQLIKACVITAA